MLNAFVKARVSPTRIGVSLAADGAVVAAVRRVAGGRPRLLFCDAGKSLAELVHAHDLDSAPLSMVVEPEDYELMLVETPDVLPAELRAAVRWRIKDLIDFHLDDAVVDVFEIPDQSRRANTRMTYAVAARADAVRRLVNVGSGAARLDVIDIPELCLRNLVALSPAARNGVALLAAETRSCLLVLVRGDTLYLSRRIELTLAGEEFAAALALEVQRSLDYCESHYDQPPISKLLVAPLDPAHASLAEAIRAEVGLDTETFGVTDLLDTAAPHAALGHPRALLAIGAALRHDPVRL